jgi:hypothetical protein
VQQRVGRAGVHANVLFHAHALDRLQRIDLLLIDPRVATDKGHAQQIDALLRVQLRQHDEGLAVVVEHVEIGVEDHLFRRLQGGRGQSQRQGQGTAFHNRLHERFPPLLLDECD